MSSVKIIARFYLPLILFSLIGSLVGLLVRNYYGVELFLSDVSGMGLLIGVVGTVYTLVSAFVVAEVWSQFNSMGEMLSQESKAISSLWNFTNYFNDAKLTKSMRESLVSYIDVIKGKEIDDASVLVRATHPSTELKRIHDIIDGTHFDDKRDSSIYPSFIEAFEELSAIRAKRIDASVSRVPLFLKSLMILLSTLLVIGFILLGFNSTGLYLFALFGVLLVTSVIYSVISDLDNPFEGVWNMDLSMLNQAKKYIMDAKQK